MYRKFFNLREEPFTASPDARFLYLMPQTREAIAALEYGIAAHKGFVVLVGEVGTGKTTLLHRALGSFSRQQIHTSFVFNPRLEVLDFLEFVLRDFGLQPVSSRKSDMLLQLNRWLIECYGRKEICVLVVDEAQNLTWELLEEIRLLTNLETTSQKLLQIVLSGQPEFEAHLKAPELRQLKQRVALWCKTRPLTEEQTGEYIRKRLEIAGTTEELFPPEVVSEIFRLSHGIPRIINSVCELSLIFSFVAQQKQVQIETLHAVSEDLSLQDAFDRPAANEPEAAMTETTAAALKSRLARHGDGRS